MTSDSEWQPGSYSCHTRMWLRWEGDLSGNAVVLFRTGSLCKLSCPETLHDKVSHKCGTICVFIQRPAEEEVLRKHLYQKRCRCHSIRIVSMTDGPDSNIRTFSDLPLKEWTVIDLTRDPRTHFPDEYSASRLIEYIIMFFIMVPLQTHLNNIRSHAP